MSNRYLDYLGLGEPIAFEDESSGGGRLLGPSGCVELHHKAVRILTRRSEDCEGIQTTVEHSGLDTGEVHVSQKPIDEILGRRGLIEIEFTCECCENGRWFLTIMQHKGSTYMGWNQR